MGGVPQEAFYDPNAQAQMMQTGQQNPMGKTHSRFPNAGNFSAPDGKRPGSAQMRKI